MFHDIPQPILDRMRYLEANDARDRTDGTPRPRRLRQIPPETGKFLALLAAGAPPGEVIEIGASAAYSTLWLALACRATGRTVTTFEVLEGKVRLAEETIRLTSTADVIRLITGDAREYLESIGPVAFCFVDAEKEVYEEVYDLLVPKMVPGALLAADNTVSHQDELEPFLQRVYRDRRVDSVNVPIGKGVLVCRRNS
jgi:caffeoyl-CoA O-methyltransferase